MYVIFLDGLSHYRIQRNYPVIFKFDSPITGDIWCGIVHTSPRFRSNVVCDGKEERKVKLWPLKVSTKLPTIYRSVILEGENIKVLGAIVSLVNEDTMTLEFPLLSSEVPGGRCEEARQHELLILPIHPELKYSEEDDVFISKESIGLRPDQSLDIQIVSVESEKRSKKLVKINREKPKLRLPKLQDEAGPSSKKCRKITDSHGQYGSILQQKFSEDLEFFQNLNSQVFEDIKETVATSHYNLIDLIYLGLLQKEAESASAE